MRENFFEAQRSPAPHQQKFVASLERTICALPGFGFELLSERTLKLGGSQSQYCPTIRSMNVFQTKTIRFEPSSIIWKLTCWVERFMS
ncbi:acyl-CoA dehydrogenase domain-containing protein [Anopheles sinensis]|uniref:Acyl-CoA dehydrogenase domain-containing protein n=1 Tax=Anopheles sinensis TaxID=74873 RepID=A0A084VBH9_ANOSI|nr:acyl-CoA dehydrogenase domain-containing protein [Anopheles sinensis]